MAVEPVKEKVSKASNFSFKLASKHANKLIRKNRKTFEKSESEEDDVSDREYVVAAEENELKSSEPKQGRSKLVIPLILKNKWRLPGADSLDAEAVSEILKDLQEGAENEVDIGPILMQNRLPIRENGEDKDESYDISIRPEQSTLEDYHNVPISAFGSAMLRGMGWSEGKPIGLNNKGLAEPIEYIPRHKGLGLGAEKRNDPAKMSRKRKLGDENIKQKNYDPIIEKDGRVRHIKGVGEEVKNYSIGFFPGCFVCIQKGAHRNHFGKITSVDEDSSRVAIQLRLSKEIIHLSRHHVDLIDEEIYRGNYKKKPSIQQKTYADKNDRDDVDPVWLVPNIRARIISDHYRKGKHYNKKVKILDVIGERMCTCQTEDGKLLEDVKQHYLETVVPKTKEAYVTMVLGEYKGQLAKIFERDSKRSRASIQLTSNKQLARASYDEISEYLGELPDDEFL